MKLSESSFKNSRKTQLDPRCLDHSFDLRNPYLIDPETPVEEGVD